MPRFKISIRLRLVVTFTLLTAIGGLLLFFIASRRLQDTTLEFYERDLESEVLIVSNSILGQLGESEDGGLADQQAVQALLTRLRPHTDRILVLFDPGLNLIAFTGDKKPSMNPLSPSVEIAIAQAGNVGRDIRVDESGNLMYYVAVPIDSEESRIQAILQIRAPLRPAYDLAHAQSLQLAGVWLPVVLLSAAMSWWVGQSLARPIQQLNASALRIAAGALNERIHMNSNDEIGQLGDSFNFMVERLNTLITAQRSFVSNAAHELRAPLMSLSLRIEAMRDETLPDDQKQVYLREAADELNRMSEMVTSLLILARLDEAKHRVSNEPFDIGLLLSDIARHWRIQAQQDGLNLHTEIPDNLPTPRISSGDLRTVLDNLLSNARKYTPAGGEIYLSAACESGLLRLEVRDTGEGFLPEEKANLFERFYRATRSRERIVSGTGLGLPIVREILEQYDATVTASSDGIDKGSTFVIRVPVM